MSDQQPEAVETTPQAPDAPQGGEQTTETPDILGQINQRLDEFGQQLPNLVTQAVAGYDYEPYQQQEPYQPEQPQDPYDGLDPNDPIQARLIQAEQRLQQFEQSSQGIQRDLWSRDLNNVLTEYPELNPQSAQHNPQAAQAVMANLQSVGVDPNSMVPPQMLVQAYKAWKADEYAKQQQPVSQEPAAGLEQAGAQQQQPAPDPAEEIFGPSNGQQNPIFSWAVR